MAAMVTISSIVATETIETTEAIVAELQYSQVNGLIFG
jgi:hypothetical protein